MNNKLKLIKSSRPQGRRHDTSQRRRESYKLWPSWQVNRLKSSAEEWRHDKSCVTDDTNCQVLKHLRTPGRRQTSSQRGTQSSTSRGGSTARPSSGGAANYSTNSGVPFLKCLVFLSDLFCLSSQLHQEYEQLFIFPWVLIAPPAGL